MIAKELLNSNFGIDIHVYNENAFRLSCEKGHLKTAQWLWQLDQNINIHANKDEAFRYACMYGHLEMAKWLLQLGKNINIHKGKEFAFRYSCGRGHLEIAKWLLQLDKNIDIYAENENAFIYACKRGHLEVAQWLWQLDQNVAGATSLRSAHDVRTSGISFYKFIGTGERSELSVSEVALATQFDQNIDIHAKNDETFRYAICNQKIARWLVTLCSDYIVVICGKTVRCIIKDENHILELIEIGKYNEAISILNIKSMPKENKHECMVCYDEPFQIIELPCHHTLCLETIIRFHVINNSVMKKCFYCQKEYQWIECKSLENI